MKKIKETICGIVIIASLIVVAGTAGAYQWEHITGLQMVIQGAIALVCMRVAIGGLDDEID